MLNGRMEPVGTVEVITADIIILFLGQLTALFSFSSMCTVGGKSYVEVLSDCDCHPES